jgi:hypothetical protein
MTVSVQQFNAAVSLFTSWRNSQKATFKRQHKYKETEDGKWKQLMEINGNQKT